MFQFFVDPGQIAGQEVMICGADVNHIKNALRMRPGERVRVSDQQGNDFLCEITQMEAQEVRLHILEACQQWPANGRVWLPPAWPLTLPRSFAWP